MSAVNDDAVRSGSYSARNSLRSTQRGARSPLSTRAPEE
jgi:hypothetical protein